MVFRTCFRDENGLLGDIIPSAGRRPAEMPGLCRAAGEIHVLLQVTGFVITKRDKAVAKLVPVEELGRWPLFGMLKHEDRHFSL